MDQMREQRIMDWYEHYYEDLYRFTLFMLGDSHDCEDVIHDTFVRAYQAIERFEERATVKTWLFSIAKHIIIDEIRKRKLQRIFSVFHEKEIISPFNIEEYVIHREAVERMLLAIQKLKPNYRLVITLKKIDECSTREVSEILGWSETKVRKTLSRALMKLKTIEEMEGGWQIEKQ